MTGLLSSGHTAPVTGNWHGSMCSAITFWFVWPLEIVPCDTAPAQCPSVHPGTVTWVSSRPVVTMSSSALDTFF